MTQTRAVPSYQQGLEQLVEELGKMLPADALAVFNNNAAELAEEFRSPLRLKPGDKAPLFSLPNAIGKTVDLAGRLEQGPVVLTFYRGVWCPYCNLQLRTYQAILPEITDAGASLIAVSPMTPDNSLSMKEANALEFDVLNDAGNLVARQFTAVFRNGDAPIRAMEGLGYDFFAFYDDDSAELPVPATFVIARDGTIVFAASGGGDYRRRVEPRDILDALAGQSRA